MANLIVTGQLDASTLGGGFKQVLTDYFLPVGSYYFTENSSLSTVQAMHNHFGGTWEKLSDEVLYAVNNTSTDVGRTEGSNNPSVPLKNHTHDITISGTSGKIGPFPNGDGGNSITYGGGGMFYEAEYNNQPSNYNGIYGRAKFSYYNLKYSYTPSGTINTSGDGNSPTIDVRGQRRRCYGYRRTA